MVSRPGTAMIISNRTDDGSRFVSDVCKRVGQKWGTRCTVEKYRDSSALFHDGRMNSLGWKEVKISEEAGRFNVPHLLK